MKIRIAAVTFLLAALLAASNAFAQLLTEKKFFTLPQYTTAGGKTIKNVRVGYETYGKLNAAGDNAVFIAHFFSGTSHAAGRYKPDEKAAGYWDAIIGPGKAIDTDKYFVVSADTLVNLNVKSPMVGTVGPATVNPDTGKPYGSSFPVVSMKDSVRVHKALLDSLGVKKLQAVAGASGGSIQAMEWGAEYPELVERVVHVIGPGLDIHPYVIGLLDIWMMPIKMDPNWKGGDYFGGLEPNEGVAQALKTVTLTALHFGWAEKVHGYKWAGEGKNPGDAMGNLFAIERSARRRDRRGALRVDGQGEPALQLGEGAVPHQGEGAVSSSEDRHDLPARAIAEMGREAQGARQPRRALRDRRHQRPPRRPVLDRQGCRSHQGFLGKITGL
jgi:homoserine O-acetyltransferase